jgi:hypothetical protein
MDVDIFIHENDQCVERLFLRPFDQPPNYEWQQEQEEVK